jgi:predicted Zn-dependent peptidase
VPTPALERALFLESDRMGYLLGAVTQAKIDNQRSVVQNEKRERANQPYGLVEYASLEGLFPEGHPYRRNPIGSMQDLNAGSLEDVKSWFRTRYGPNNAVLVLAGDIDAKTARPLVERHFGAIARGPDTPRASAPVPERSQTTREVIPDQVPTPRLYRYWVAPGRNAAEQPLLGVAAAVLADGSASRFYNDLVRDRKLATSVAGMVTSDLLASQVRLQVDLAPGVDPAVAEARIDELLAQFLREGPTPDEVERVATRVVGETIRGLEQVGGFTGKAAVLAEGALYAGDPGFYRTTLQRYASATPASVRAAAARWMNDGDFRLQVVPGTRTPDDLARVADVAAAPAAPSAAPRAAPASRPTATAAGSAGARKLPDVKGFPQLDLPSVERTRLSNGVEVQLARRAAVPVVQMAMSFDAGSASDPKDKRGLASLTAALLDEGTDRRSALQITEEAERLGATFGGATFVDTSAVFLLALKPNLAASLDLLADVLRNPTFPRPMSTG